MAAPSLAPFGPLPNCGVQASVGIGKWIYLRSEFPLERLLHLTATGTRFCFAKGRQHKGQHVMLTVDLVAQVERDGDTRFRL